ncbi:MAG: hypothetical protein ACYSWX_09475, partial [Planctomycetota bacterium]
PAGMRRVLERQFKVKTLAGFGVDDDSEAVPAAGALIEYLEETQKTSCSHVRRIEPADPGRHLVLDRATRSCLELVATQREGRREGTLLVEYVDGRARPARVGAQSPARGGPDPAAPGGRRGAGRPALPARGPA